MLYVGAGHECMVILCRAVLLLFFLVLFFTSSKLKYVNEIYGLNLKNVGPPFFKSTFSQSVSILSNFDHPHFVAAS